MLQKRAEVFGGDGRHGGVVLVLGWFRAGAWALDYDCGGRVDDSSPDYRDGRRWVYYGFYWLAIFYLHLRAPNFLWLLLPQDFPIDLLLCNFGLLRQIPRNR